MEIVQAEIADAEQLLHLQQLAYQSEAELYGDRTIPPLTQTLSELKDEFSRTTILKALIDAAIVGSVRASECDGIVSIGRLFVHPSCQHKGIGKQLVSAIESKFPEARSFELFTGSLSEGNIRFYQTMGYRMTHTKVLSEKVTMVFLQKLSHAE
jgi:GNAT superfamily N-acetyltransferase